MKNKNSRSNNVIQIVQWVIIIILVVAVGFFGYQYWQDQNSLNVEESSEEELAQTLKEKINDLAVIPDEAVRVTQIENVDELKTNPFFTNAKNGDQLLIFEGGLLLVYNPDENKVVAMQYFENNDAVSEGVEENGSETTDAGEEEVPQNVTITILNGTTSGDVIDTVEAKLIRDIEGVEVVERLQASQAYTESSIIDDGGGNGVVVAQIAGLFGFTQGEELSEAESLPEGDIVIIIGSDYIE